MESNIAQILLIFGFSWSLVGCAIGFYQGVKHTSHRKKLEGLSRANDLEGYHTELARFKQKTNAHAHSMLFPVMLVLVALAIPQMNLPEQAILILGVILIAATVTWSIGGIMDLKPIKGLGDILLVISIIITAAGLYLNL